MAKSPNGLPEPKDNTVRLGGGLDMVTPQMFLESGYAIQAMNYEIPVTGGYARLGGYERFDGHASPSSGGATILFSTTAYGGAAVLGATLTGNSSGATGNIIVLGASTAGATQGQYVVLDKVVGSFTNGETLKVGGTSVGTYTTTPGVTFTLFDQNFFAETASNDLRTAISAVPGSGSVLGVQDMNGNVYAWRNNSGGTAALMYVSSSSGWTAVNLGIEVYFNAGNNTTAIAAGNTVTGLSSGAHGVVAVVVNQNGGSWTSGLPTVGKLTFLSVTGTFTNGEALQVSGTTLATASNATKGYVQAAITLAPNGRYDFRVWTFIGNSTTPKIYGVDGANRAFEFDGTNYVTLDTGMPTDTPAHIEVNQNMLFLAFQGAMENSGPGLPYQYTAVTGSAEFALGDVITGFLLMPGNNQTAALLATTKTRLFMLYGTSTNTFSLNALNAKVGARAWSHQVTNQPIFLDQLGLTTLTQTLQFGNFIPAAVSNRILPLIQGKIDQVSASVVLRSNGQYKLFFNDGSGLTATFIDGQLAGFIPFQYNVIANCACESTLNGGSYWIGGTNGYVYQINKGRSFDGAAMPYFFKLAYNHCGSPQYRKRFMWAEVDMIVQGAGNLSVGYTLTLGAPDADQTVAQNIQPTGAGASLWDQGYWDQMYWDASGYTRVKVPLDVSGTDISLQFSNNTDQELPHTIQAIRLVYLPRRRERN